MNLSEIIKERIETGKQIAELTEAYNKSVKPLRSRIEELSRLEGIAAANIDTDKIVLAEKLLKVYGNIYGHTDSMRGNDIATEAINDIATGCRHLKKEFFGNKQYSGFYQRNDCEYGFGPSYGSTVDMIGLTNEARGKELSTEEKDACIYYLKNYKSIQAAVVKK